MFNPTDWNGATDYQWGKQNDFQVDSKSFVEVCSAFLFVMPELICVDWKFGTATNPMIHEFHLPIASQ